MTKTIYLMRHGETLFNTQKRVQGWCDSPLTEKGIEQARKAGRWFQDKHIQLTAVYSSTQERATDTARLVSGKEEVVQVKGLKEMNFGSFEAQPENLLPKFRPGAKSFEDLLVPYGGEDIFAVGKRVHQAVLEIAQKEQEDTILMVSHGAALWGLVLDLEAPVPAGTKIGNCNIYQYAYNDGKLSLQKIINPLTGEETQAGE